MRRIRRTVSAGILLLATGLTPAFGQEADLAKKLNNPIADLISVPFQFNYDGKIGPSDKGGRTTLNFQPVTSNAAKEMRL